MDIEKHFRSLSAEFEAVKNRVFNLIGDAHWPTHGDWRESILRSVLRRHLPENIKVARGFIVDGVRQSTEIDVLLYHAAAPVLYRELDLVVVTPNAVLGIIEVKSTIRRGELREIVEKLASNSEFINGIPGTHLHRPAVGLFAYDIDGGGAEAPRWVFRELQAAAASHPRARIRQLCFGGDYFVHHWSSEPGTWPNSGGYDRWHLYNLRGLAAGYFVSNVIAAVAPEFVIEHRAVWFPEQSKEQYLVDTSPVLAAQLEDRG
ncbi:MAG: hypothetical protein LC667_09720 [Thioalkalivibrio sp.]|nr:hypothetical protein [Thioalkalivibrio sp.]